MARRGIRVRRLVSSSRPWRCLKWTVFTSMVLYLIGSTFVHTMYYARGLDTVLRTPFLTIHFKPVNTVHNTSTSLGSASVDGRQSISSGQKALSKGRSGRSEMTVPSNLNQIVAHVSETKTTVRPVQRTHPKDTRTDGVKNPHDFRVLHSAPHTCMSRDVELIVAVPSIVHEFKERSLLRSNRGRDRFFANPENKARQLFFLGAPSGSGAEKIQKQVNVEASAYGDVVQEDFVDSYDNLTYKSISIAKWVTEVCPTSKYVIKSDLDVSVKFPELLQALRRQYDAHEGLFVIGRRRDNAHPIRNVGSRWYTPYETFSRARFPTFTNGPTYGFTTKAAFKLYEASLQIPYFRLEDIYFTGLCSEKAIVPVISDELFNYVHLRRWKNSKPQTQPNPVS